MQYSRCDIFSKILQELLEKSGIPSPVVHKMILKDKMFQKKLSLTDKISIKTLLTDGFTKLDVTLIYKIVKYFKFIPPPSRNWGSKPMVHEKEIGDDVERIRQTRNNLVHRIDCNVTDIEFNEFFDEFIELGRRIDVYLGKPNNVGFEKDITYFKTCPMDEYLQWKYIRAIEEIACLKEKGRLYTNKIVFRVYYGTTIEDLIRDVKDETAIGAQCPIKSSLQTTAVKRKTENDTTPTYESPDDSSEEEIENDKTPTCKSETELLSELGLEMYYPDKIDLFDIVKIQPSYSNIKLSNIPWVFLENIISLNYNARDEILEEQLEQSKCVPDEFNKQVDFLDNLLGSDALLTRLNPIDLTVAIFNCCSPVVKQIIASKMFMCRLAIPFVFPQCRNEAMVVSIWPIRKIVIERELSHIGAVDCPCNVVSFVRTGYTSVSKSKMINEIISNQYHCTFVNKDSPLGSTTRWISNGLVEMAWYIPSTNSRLFSNVTACLNLRGDCDVHRPQLHFMSHFSDAIVIMVDIHEMKNERFMQLITEVYNTNVMVILSIDAIRCNKEVLKKN
ncbi:unnamed protein product [Mytilus edulis]|uniref:Up-regulator of cell proliferation-like domain-containing protein n=1 Tax=Mytilus edulis TaxID=6550 RepID=A0A8S3QKW4_MYTED|nr:unnamed protein product [Mytilus edulis]